MKTFNYSSKASIKDNLTEILIGAALIIGPIVYPFGIKIGATRILGPFAHCYYPCDCRSIHAIQSMAKNTAGPYIGS